MRWMCYDGLKYASYNEKTVLRILDHQPFPVYYVN